METKRLIEILEKNRAIQKIELPKVSNAREFWRELTTYVYGSLPCNEVLIDEKTRDAMRSFAESDSLDLLNKQGKLLKRFGKFFKGMHGFPLDDRYMGIIGDRLQYHVSQETKPFYVDFTNVIDWRDGMFGKDDSCWWGCYSDSRECFTEGGGWGVRFYENEEDARGIGRLWIMPKYNVLLCFNAYGVQRARASKVVKAIFDREGIELHYKKVELYNSHHSEIPYINTDSTSGSSGAFVLYVDEKDLQERYDIDCEYEDNKELCYNCSQRIDENEGTWVNDYYYCEQCTNNLFSYCESCSEYCSADDVHEIRGHRHYDYMCNDCAENRGAGLCDECGVYDMDYTVTNDGNCYCEGCRDSHCFHCEHCEEDIEDDQDRHNRENHNPCEDCNEVFNSSDDLYDHNTECHPELIIELAVY